MRALLLALLLPACASEGSPSDASSESATCMALAGEHTVTAIAEAEGRTSCTVDADCVLVTPILECPEGDHYEECPLALATGQESAYRAALAADTAHLCEDGLDCLSIPGCPPAEAVCEEGQCVTIATGP